MKKIVRVSIKSTLSVLFLFLAVSIYFYYTYHSQLSYEVIQLENRSGIHLINNIPTIRGFFVTNREVQKDPMGGFNAINAKKLTYGISYVEIPNTFRIGNNFEFSKLHVELYKEQNFITQLRKSIHQSASKLLVIWIHGYKNNFNDAAALLSRGAYDLNTEATYLFFSWPSQDRFLSYEEDEIMEKDSAPYLAQFLIKIRNEIPEAKLVLIGHSLGTRLICDAFDILYQQKTWKDTDNEIQEVILIAPDVNEDDFDNNFKKQILAMVKRLTIYVASDDNALLISHFRYSNKPLGLPNHFKPDTQLDEVQSLLAIDSLESHFDIIDATYIIKPEFFKHQYYRSRPIITDIYWILNDSFSTQKRPLYRSKLIPNKNYWILPP